MAIYGLETVGLAVVVVSSLLLRQNALVGAQNSNVVMTRTSGIAVATQGTRGGLLLRSKEFGQEQQEFPLPAGIVSLDDVAVDPENESLVFALSVSIPPTLCSYQLDTTLSLINCVGSSFQVSPFSGVSAFGGTLVISGGTGGLTVYDYDTATGKIESLPRIENFELPQVIGHPDVLMLDSTTAALSTDFSGGGGGGDRFGTLIASVATNTPTAIRQFRVPNSIGFDLFAGSTNFPLVNAALTIGGRTYLYTANGAITVQEISGGAGATTTTNIVGAPAGFQAVTVATNIQQDWIVFGGLVGGTSQVIVMDASQNPTSPTLLTTAPVSGRVTSVASQADIIAHVTVAGSDITFFTMNGTTGSTGPPAPTPSPPGFTSPPSGRARSFNTCFLQLLGLSLTAMTWAMI